MVRGFHALKKRREMLRNGIKKPAVYLFDYPAMLMYTYIS